MIAALRMLDPDGGDGVLREVVTLYLEDTPLRLREMEQAAAEGANERFVRAAHSLKGGSASLGVTRVRLAAGEAETAARNGGLSAGATFLPALRKAWDEAAPHLRQLLG